MADGAYRWQGQTPAPDAARVEAIVAAYDETEAHAFAEPARATALARIDQALAAVRAGDLPGAADVLTRARALLDDLRPARLEPRRGLAGLFDSRGRRLRDFREAWRTAAGALSAVADDLTARADDATRHTGVLDDLWTGVRDGLIDLDAHLLAAVRRLARQVPTEDAPAHPLESRKAALDACRAAALATLPLIRGAQTGDARAAAALTACADGVEAWKTDWRQALGLAGKRPKRVRPDPDQLSRLRDDLLARIDRALTELTTARQRRSDVEARRTRLRAGL